MIIKIIKKNEVYLHIECEYQIKKELYDYFTFDVPNAKFMPQYKSGVWDGKIHLFSPGNSELYGGLYRHLLEFCDNNEYTYEIINNNFYGSPEDVNDISIADIIEMVKNFGITFEPRDYQLKTIHECLKYKKRLILSATSSGKSFSIYCIVRHLTEQGCKTLIIVPTTTLTTQLYKDFESYGWESEKYCHKIYAGKSKTTNLPVIISTYQSLSRMPKKYFDDIGAVIVDEAHTATSTSIKGIMEKLHNAEYRLGFTGTLRDAKSHRLFLEGNFGLVENVISAKELMNRGYAANLKIKVLLLKHNKKSFSSYHDEIDYLVSNTKRNNLIKNLVKDLKGNTLVLFSLVEKHGKILYDLMKNDKDTYFVHGGVDTEIREQVRNIVEETEKDSVIISSYQVFQQGINIKNLHNVVFASPSKSKIRNLQSIGRVLRVKEGKTHATLYDIADEIPNGNYKNFTLNHMMERIKTYASENFDYEIINVNINDEQ